MNNTRILQFLLAKGVGDVSLKKLFEVIDRNQISLEDFDKYFDECIRLVCGKKETIENIISMNEPAKMLNQELFYQGIQMVSEIDLLYPKHLKQKLGNKCPPLLFVKGNVSLLNSKSVGFCGSRKASIKGINIAEECVKQLVDKKITVTSGYASGIDLAAHKKALQCGGNTIFVLAEGILRSTIKNDIRYLLNPENHIFVSQFLPNITWNVGNAMKRNSVIIGLSRAMILVESGKTGGTFAAGEESLQTKCPLFVIDFAKPEVSAEANPYFIAKGGYPIRGRNGIPNLEKLLSIIDSNEQEAFSQGDQQQLIIDLNQQN